MAFPRLIILLIGVFAVVFPSYAMAQDTVAARTGSHKGYARLVMEWPAKPGYTLSKEGDRILIRFAKAGLLDSAGVNAADANVRKIETMSNGTEPLQIGVTIPAGSRFRDFVVENKLIIDVYDPEGVATPTQKADSAPAPVAPVASTPAQEKKKPAATAPAPAEQPASPVAETPTTTAPDFTIQPTERAATAPLQDVESNAVAAPAMDAHAITLTTTTGTGMAAYTRNGMLWVVLDATDLQAAPQIVGPQKEKFPPLEKMETEDGAVYRVELPDGTKAYGDGGGLNWRIALTPETQKTSPVIAETVAADTGARLVWPLKDMRRIITFTDPMVGDKVTVVTASNASQMTGAGRNYINLQTLDSAIGLAFIAKSDDVKAEKTVGAVSVGRPGGLALSSAKDTEPEKIRQAMEEKPPEEKTEAAQTDAPAPAPQPDAPVEAAAAVNAEEAEVKKDIEHAAAQSHDAPKLSVETVKADSPSVAEMSKAAEEKPAGNNIYNFARWEMGGIPALDNNMHILMTEMSDKTGEMKPEDILTMAKLNVANDRGAEALGLLRMALGLVPELEENAEFQALRGAALALTHKYDEAILDYSRGGVKKYDDVKYWTAYVLAGLEDWKQAIAVMRKVFGPVAEYPKDLRRPLILTFAEVALRGGDAAMANRILDILKPDLPTLPLPYASYWNYLAGEAARQSGDPDQAVAYWEPLVKNGKDDLFRAKAGLSLTKLLLDQKKIKSVDAINTLEGLRYAWRGDELETLINYRLGQMYVDNKDYLKGLTVLRNASSLSPGTDINADVKTYMVGAFRQVFGNDRLKTISPLEAISLHEEFKDLVPPGPEGDSYVEKLAERLVDADLLGRAAALLEYQVNNRLTGDKKAEIAIRLAAIRLLDGNADGALRSLEIAQDSLDKIAGVKAAEAPPAPQDVKPEAGETTQAAASVPAPVKETVDPEKQRQIYLLKARALSMNKKTDEAMAILEAMPPDPDVNRLRTDIAWSAGRWEEAGLALNDLITSEDISSRRPLTEYQRDIILNRAIALNLSGNRVALSNLRERYNAQMKDTPKGQMFEIVTRPRRPDMIGSRQAIESMISEISLFEGFVDSYAKSEAGKNVAEPAPPKTPVPADGKATETAPGAKTPEAEKKVTTLPE